MRSVLLFVLVAFLLAPSSAWKRTKCGPGDLVTTWGAQVDPNNVLPEYPRPQMTRGNDTWLNLNGTGLWQFQPAPSAQAPPPFNQTLNMTILVPFPVESCLSGIGQNYQYLWYRQLFNLSSSFWSPTAASSRLLIHFGAVDWQAAVYLNGQMLGIHQGGYDGFSFDISSYAMATNNELIVSVYDPSDLGFQPNGKQRISAITSPEGDTYTPSSGIWQTVWLEVVPETYIQSITILTDTRTLTVSATLQPTTSTETVTFAVFYNSTSLVAKGVATNGNSVSIPIPNPRLWWPSDPFLYTLTATISGDVVTSYFGLRSFELADVQHPGSPDSGPQVGIDRPGGDLPGFPVALSSADPNLCWNMCKNNSECVAWAYAVPGCDTYEQPMCWLKGVNEATTPNKCRVSGSLGTPASVVKRPYLNGGFLFLTGWLDQSFWPDGLYTAPTDEALRFDLEALSTFGLNVVRLHQKVNPERWYYWADTLGVIVFQDAVQKYGGATAATVAPFTHDITAMITGRYNHPCIVQWTVFNEEDCFAVFNVSEMVNLVRSLDPSRLTDTDSGGPANSLYIGDVNDVHTYPNPGNPAPSFTQYGMIGEYGGLGAYVNGHMWVPNQCQSYLQVNGSEGLATTYIEMLQSIESNKDDISVVIYTQITDVERECDGFLNYDRTPKFTTAQQQAVAAANANLIVA